MYSTCLFCNSDLGANEVIENFPVGRRLAYDAAKGRLWVVCRKCERWNLSPLEERWEAIEEMERLYRDTRLRVSSENIGLARLKEGLELVRIGEPQRPEMAAWRYGDQFGRRRRRYIVRAGIGLGALGAVVVGGVTAGIGLGGFWWWGRGLIDVAMHGSPNKVVARIPNPEHGIVQVRRKDLDRVSLRAGATGPDWRLVVPVRHESGKEEIAFTGDQALRAAGVVLPAMNRFGGSRRQVDEAVQVLEQAGDPLRCFDIAARSPARRQHGGTPVHHLDYPVRLALEMAAHEEAERRALEGELAELERAWQEAEEIAAISDSLLVPERVDERLARLRRGPDDAPG
ncbi:MAG TPA: hypothetical protein VFL93_10415 [Longimicrobiaceae bacterium]|nr:hypothetical protein [Longimicrobiaceae bacterium]